MNERTWLRLDLVIATLALIISAGATVSSIYQTHVIARQLGASVWPYLSITSSLGDSAYSLAVANDGLGPAVVKNATLSVDGEKVANYREAEGRLARGVRVGKDLIATFSSINETTVVRAGDTRVLIRASGSAVSQVGDLGKRVSLSLCYCSLLDECWTVVSHEPRVDVRTCATNAGIEY